MRNDPALVAKVRDLRDRYLEAVHAGRFLIEPAGRYDVAPATSLPSPAPRQLPLAA